MRPDDWVVIEVHDAAVRQQGHDAGYQLGRTHGRASAFRDVVAIGFIVLELALIATILLTTAWEQA